MSNEIQICEEIDLCFNSCSLHYLFFPPFFFLERIVEIDRIFKNSCVKQNSQEKILCAMNVSKNQLAE